MTYWSSQVTDGQVALASLTGVTCYLIHLGKFITLKILISTSLRPAPNPMSHHLQPWGLGKLYCLLIERATPTVHNESEGFSYVCSSGLPLS